jgi:lipopolysaccharide/colanic/teichoic acid biosynthesis glycosyltransferase
MKTLNQPIQSLTFTNSKAIYFYYKRLLDLFVSITALVILHPILLVICILIRFDSKGPIFFIQERMGKDGVPFTIIKFRTMNQDSEKDGPQWVNKDDIRITQIGYFLRKYRLDETPQFINVIKGEMSLIGPRPERKVFMEEFERELPHFSERLKVKPGITDWAQTNGGYELTQEEKLNLDLYYINHLSYFLDLKIVFQSFLVIIFTKGWR